MKNVYTLFKIMMFVLLGTVITHAQTTANCAAACAAGTPVANTQSADNATVIDGDGIACNYGAINNFEHADNSFVRVYENLADETLISCICFGVDDAISGDGSGVQPASIVVSEYIDDGNGVTFANLPILAIEAFDLEDADDAVRCVTLGVPVTVDAGASVAIELFVPDGSVDGHVFSMGTNDAGQTGASYIAAPACNAPDLLPVSALLGQTGRNFILDFYGCAIPPAPVTCSSDSDINVTGGGGAIPDNGGPLNELCVTVDVAQAGCTIADINVVLDADHTWVGDLIFTLTSPSGIPVVLIDRPGVPPSTVGNGDDLVAPITLDDEAASGVNAEDIGDATPNEVGEDGITMFIPEEALTAFDGEDPEGTWTLCVSDNAFLDPGVLNSFTLNIETAGCTTVTPVVFDPKDYDPQGDNCPYFLVLQDSEGNGWDGASIDVSLNEAWPAANHKLVVDECNRVIPLYINDGGTIDLEYWNGAFEEEHYFTVYDVYGNVAVDTDGNPVQYGPFPPAGQEIRIKAQCPDLTCADATEDFEIRITMGFFPIEQSWELYEGESSTTAQGTQVIGINATAYAALAPGTEVSYNVTLDLCGTYTFVAFDGYNDGWDTGEWAIFTDNLNYGTEVTSFFDSNFGDAVVVANPANNFFPGIAFPFGQDEDRVQFTLPCEPTCEDAAVTDASLATCTTAGPVALPVNEPEVCYPNCYHGLPDGCIMVQHILLVTSVDYAEIAGTEVPYTGQVDMDFDGTIPGFAQGEIPVGCHKYVTKYTYCDGIMTKCTAELNIVTSPNPSMTCNDNVLISLATPDAVDDNGSLSLADDLGECVVRVTPDMVLEMPESNCFGVFEEYEVIIIDTDGEPLVVHDATFGLPLDAFGFPILPGANTEPANNLIGPDQLMQTLTYVVKHKFSGNTCWGTLTVEDKAAPEIICHDYDLPCTHPHALDEDYTHTDIYEAAAELPANIAGGQLGLESNTWIPVNLPSCISITEVIQDIEINVSLSHNDVTDLQIWLAVPTALENAIIANGGAAGPYLLADNFDVGTNNTIVPANAPGLSPELIPFLGILCNAAETTNPENFVTENSGGFTPANLGGTWYIKIVDNDLGDSSTTEPVGGGQVTAASITLTCGFPEPYSAYDCSLEEVTLLNEMVAETNCDQSDWNGAQIMRIWQAVDKFGNSTTCTQTVNLKAPTMDQIEKPGDITLDCQGQSADEITPELSGIPTFGCFDLTDDLHAICDISYSYDDQVLNTCGEGFKIIRTWTIINWCSGVTKQHEQVIKVEDTDGPTIAQENVVAGTDNYACTADVSLEDLGIEDNCSGLSSVIATYTQGGSVYQGNGQLTIVDLTNGGTLADLPLGTTEITLTAKDQCLNVTTKDITITIFDNTVPIAVCDDELHVSLGGDGTARLYAEDIDEGSYDNCGDITLQVRRTDGCLGTSAWDDYVPFECCDTDELITVELLVTDEAGNTNICWKQVLVEDALPPTIVCPEDKTIDCNDPSVHNPFGAANADDNCVATITHVDGGELDNCYAGVLTRTFTATDGSAKSADVECTQSVTVVHVSDFTVQFPADVTLDTCPDSFNAGEPNISNDDCELVAVSSEDQRFDIVSDACYKIERTWTIVNWCIYDQGNPANTALGLPQPLPRTYQDDDGYFQYVQIIKVLDEDAPIIDCPGDQTFCDLTDGCEGEAQLVLTATDGCSNDDALEYAFKIDLDNDGDFDIVSNGNDATGIYDYGTHLIKWVVEDGCGNTSVCSYLFTVEDCKNPTPVCLNGISIPAMNSNGCVSIWASDLLEYAFDNCSPDQFVEESVKMRLQGSDAAPQSELTLCCDLLGTVLVEIWVWDEAGNSDYCTTYIILQDNTGICDGSDSASVAGNIQTENGNMVEEVMVEIDGAISNAIPTGATGSFVFPNLAMHTDYSVTPEKDSNPLNGVSTYDLVVISQHILGISNLDSPYKLIAADANNDGNISTFDIVQLRQLILYVVNDFPSNTSWRFVDQDYIFPNPQNPWAAIFPEKIDINGLSASELAADFVGVKIGDVTGDATTNSLLGSNDRNATSTMLMTVADATVNAGETVTVDFLAKDFNNIDGYQFTLGFDATAMTFAGVKAGALNVTEANFGLNMITEGVITTSWNTNTATTVANDEVLFSLTFAANANATLSEALAINNRYTKAEAYTGTALANVNLAFNTTNGTIVAGEGFALYQNTPNPFNATTNISFNLAAASKATLKVYDVAGKTLKIVEGNYAKGLNTITIDSKELGATGVLYYQLDTDTNSATKKMIIVK